jgi:gas vesicle protein
MIQEKQSGITQNNLKIFPVRDAVRMNGSQNLNAKNAGINPPNGVVVNYFLKNFADSALLNIKVLDKNKNVIKTFSTKAPPTGDIGKIDANKGMNQFVWDMMYPEAEKVEGMILWNNIRGLKAAPGTYYVRIINDKKDSAESEFTIRANPNYKTPQQEYEEQFSFLSTVKDKFNEIQKAIKNIREVRKQISDFMARQGKDTSGEIKILADSINKRMTRVEEALYQTKAKSEQDVLNYPIRLNDKIAGLYSYAASGNYSPTAQVREAYADLSAQADAELNKLKIIFSVDVPRLNQLIREKQLPVIGVKKE